MELPLFPLNVVLFPGMVLPLHIFEPRYREMINLCIESKTPFGVVLHADGQKEGVPAEPTMVGTAARIVRVKREPDGRLNITSVGTQRFRIEEFDRSAPYLKGIVRPLPVLNAGTKSATDLMQMVRPKVLEYVDIMAKASNAKIALDRLPQDPKTLAFLVAIALQVNNADKQQLLELPGIPNMLAREHYLLSREMLMLQYMLDTQPNLEDMSSGPTGYIFPN